MITNTQTPQLPKSTGIQLLEALGFSLLIIIVEYFARIYVANWLPSIGAFRVNDMLSSAFFYGLLIVITTPLAKRYLSKYWHTLQEVAAVGQAQMAWVWAFAFLATTRIGVVDQWLWGNLRFLLPEAPRNASTLLPELGQVLAIVSLILVHGLLVPLAEERLWRGIVQPRLVRVLGFVPGLFSTALLFSLKHVIVDASLARLLALTAAGIVLGYIGARKTWKYSAFVHTVGNILGLIVALITGNIVQS